MTQWTKAEIKAELAKQGSTLAPDAKMTFRARPQGATTIIVVDRVRAGYTPPYCCHGYASCVCCDTICYLGHESVKMVEKVGVAPVCMECATELAESNLLPSKPFARVKDHLRADGPHDD